MKRSLILYVLLSACGYSSNWTPETVGSLVSRRCAPCHHEGGAAVPLSAQLGGLMLDRVERHLMPPGQPAADSPPLADDPRLTRDELDVFTTWASRGYPEFAAAAQPDAFAANASLRIAGYRPTAPTPGGAPDEYRCFAMHGDPIGGKWIRGYRWVVGVPAEVHHLGSSVVDASSLALAQAMDRGNGWDCGIDAAAGQIPWLASLGTGAGGSRPVVFPDGAGIYVPPGGGMIYGVHYVKGISLLDVSGVDLALTDVPARPVSEVVAIAPAEMPCSKDPRGLPASDPCSRAAAMRSMPGTDAGWLQGINDMWLTRCGYTLDSYYRELPFDDGSAEHFLIRSQCTSDAIAAPGMAIGVHLHAHTYTTGGSVRLVRSSGAKVELVHYDAYDWAWETSLILRDPVRVEPGDRVEVECQWDNGRARQWGTSGPAFHGAAQPPLDPPRYHPTATLKEHEMCNGSVQVAQ